MSTTPDPETVREIAPVSVFAAAVAAVRPLLLGGTIRDAERIVLAVLRAALAAADDGYLLTRAEAMEQLAAANERAALAEAEAERCRQLNRNLARSTMRHMEKLNEARAQMAGIGRPTEWGQPRTEWTWSARKPDGTAIPPMFPDPPPRTEDEVRREFDGVVDNMGYRKALLCREVTAWRDAEPADAAQNGRSATETNATPPEAAGVELEFGEGTAGLSETHAFTVRPTCNGSGGYCQRCRGGQVALLHTPHIVTCVDCLGGGTYPPETGTER